MTREHDDSHKAPPGERAPGQLDTRTGEAVEGDEQAEPIDPAGPRDANAKEDRPDRGRTTPERGA